MSATKIIRVGNGTTLVKYGPEIASAIAVTDASRIAAQAAEVDAEGAAAAALAALGAEPYASTALGLAGTVEGETFWVDNGDGTGSTYRHDAGPAATLLTKFIIDPAGSGSAALLGASSGGTVQSELDAKAATANLISLDSPLAVTAATALTADQINRYVVCSGTTADYTLNLPPVTAANIGDAVHVRISRSCTKLITIQAAAASGLNIDGQSIRVMWAGEDALLVYDGTEWGKIQGQSIPFIAKLNCSATKALASTFAYIPLVQGEQLNDEATTVWFDTSWFKSPRDSVYHMEINLWASNFAGGDSQVDVGNIKDSGTPSTAIPSENDFVRLDVIAAGTYRTLKADFIRRVAKGNYFCPTARFNSPTTAANVGTLSSNVTITEIPVW